MIDGILNLPVWGSLLVALCLTHVTIAAVTIFLHRHQAHRALDLHPVSAHLFRFWLWLTTGMVTAQWVAVHRKHHANCEGPNDPHSPVQKGLATVLLKGTELYRGASRDPAIIAQYGYGTPDDWLERRIYSKHTAVGVSLMLVLDLVLFGAIGLTVWAIQMIWIPFFAAGVINGMGHATGYRNFETRDASRNIVPWGILIGGEELHNNHHAYAGSARLSSKWWEFDIGWLYIRTLSLLGLARVRKVPPRVVMVAGKTLPDMETLKAVVTNRLDVMSQYAQRVLKQVHAEEMQQRVGAERQRLRGIRRALVSETSRLSHDAQNKLNQALADNQTLQTVYDYRLELQAIWEQRADSQERLLKALQEWCQRAEQSGISALGDFADYLRGYAISVRPA